MNRAVREFDSFKYDPFGRRIYKSSSGGWRGPKLGAVDRSRKAARCAVGDVFDLFVFHFAFCCEVIWFLQPGQRNQSPSPQGNAEVYEAGAEGNGRDRSGSPWRDRVLGDPAPVPWFAP